MLFISTGGLYNKPAATSALKLYEYGINSIELSGGSYSITYKTDLLSLSENINFQVHNYFPPPKIPFVFNLASSDPVILERSISHVRTATRLAISLGRPVYSFHAGFRINPSVNELGRALKRRELCERETALNRFGESVLMLAEEARQEGVDLLIENNVLNSTNLGAYGEDPLLLTHPDEIEYFMNMMPENVGLLLDVAHLKVTAGALGFDLKSAHNKLKPLVKGYHLSDNDGMFDSNEVVTETSWFWQDLARDLNYYTLEVYRVSYEELVDQYDLVMKKLSNDSYPFEPVT